MKKILLTAGAVFASVFLLSAVPVKADMGEAIAYNPLLQDIYHLEDAKQDLRGKSNKLKTYQDSGSPQKMIDATQNDVNAAAKTLANINSIINNQTMMIALSPNLAAVGTPLIDQAAVSAAQAAQLALTKQAEANQAALNAFVMNQALLLNQATVTEAAKANQNAVNKQLEANQAAAAYALANQNAAATAVAYNPLVFASVASTPVNPPYAHNLVLLDNINKISEAQTKAKGAREIANATLSRINNIRPALESAKAQAAYNPAYAANATELQNQLNALEASYASQSADASEKEATFQKLQATLPTAGYDPMLVKYYYANW
ncbi:MAG: hypothetical protein K6G83_15740 [Lachnospiraceae bacterium]|nr:hypothetical protein [Lachnospiraceae bacterium]